MSDKQFIDTIKKAVSENDISTIKNGLKGKPADLADEFDETLLMHAALSGKLEIVIFLIEEKAYDINFKSLNKANALIRASLSGKLEVVKYLAEKGSDLDAVEIITSRNACSYSVHFGWESHEGTALHAAIAIDSLPITVFLFDRGASPIIKSPRGHTAFEQAIRYGKIPIVEFIADSLKLSISDQVIAAARLNHDMLKYYIEKKKALFDFQDSEGMTPMMLAIKDGDYKFLGPGPHPGSVNYKYNITEYLLNLGADPNHRNIRSQTPLMIAASIIDSNLIELLVAHKANPDDRDNKGKQAIDYIIIPDPPPEAWENSYMSWCYESAAIEDVITNLKSLMKKKAQES